MEQPKPRGGAEAYSKVHLDKLLKDNRELNQRIDSLQRENKQLKKSYFDLTVKYDVLAREKGGPIGRQPFDIDSVLAQTETDSQLDDPDTGRLELAGPIKDRQKDGRLFSYKSTLKGHTGAVYVVQHSPCGRLLATGSFDTNVLLWDAHQHRLERAMKGHRLVVSDLCWTNDSQAILSTSFDGTAKVWSVDTEAPIKSFDVGGFGLSIRVNPQDNRIFMVGSSSKKVSVFDQRTDKAVRTIDTDHMANTLYVYRDGSLLVVGDAAGTLKTYHVASGQCLETFTVEENRQPISHICVPRRPQAYDDQEERYLAVNSHDNVIRVYDRGAMPPTTTLRLHAAVKGHINKGWPIRSAFFLGSNYQSFADAKNVSDSGSSNGPGDLDRQKSVFNTAIVATGSADGVAYVYDVGSEDGKGELIQRLEGHTDRVYCVDFHPSEPILATSSADSTVRMWSAKAKRLVPAFEK